MLYSHVESRAELQFSVRLHIELHFCFHLFPVHYNMYKGGKFLKNCGAALVGVLQDNLVLSTGLIV